MTFLLQLCACTMVYTSSLGAELNLVLNLLLSVNALHLHA